jgi:predicted amidohydrolase YtcJ
MVTLGKADLILVNGQFHTVDRENPLAEAVAVRDGKFLEVGTVAEVMQHHCDGTKVVDLKGHTAIPGLNDSHLHLIRGGLNYNLELRWEGVPSLADALRMLKEQALRTPSPQWVRVVGGWTEFQFAERRMPTLDEINDAAPDTPVFILHLYDRALLNRAALKVVGYTKDTPNPPGGEIQRDANGNPTGMLIARPNAMILYATLAKGPKLPLEQQVNSTRQFMRELNRLGLTSAIDAGGGFQNYPEDYEVIAELHEKKQMTIRIAYNLFTQRPGHELEDFEKWTDMLTPGQGSDFFRHNGAGEMLVFSAADFEDFLEPRPDLAPGMEDELERVVRHLVEHRWPFRLHATYNESISRMLDVFEKVNRDIPFNGLHWFFDHAETVSQANIDRIKALGGGIAVQHRMAFQGSTLPSVMALKPPATRRRWPKCWRPASRWAGHRRHPRGELQPVDRALLAGLWPYRRRDADVRSQRPSGPRYRPDALDPGQRVVLQRAKPEGADQGRPARRPRRAEQRLLPRAGRGDQGHRVRPDGGERRYRLRRRHLWPARATCHSGPARVVPGGEGAGPLPQRAAAGRTRRHECRSPLQRPVRGSQPPA